MLLKLLLLFTLVPLVELYLLVRLGQAVGPGLTVAVVAVTGAVGVLLAKSEGLAVLVRIRSSLEAGELPGDSLLDGLFILLGGAFLLTPGLLTDALGFMFLLPLPRLLLKKWLRWKLADLLYRGDVDFYIRRW